MILRYIVFAAIVIFCVFVMLVLVKDTGSERKKIEKQIKSTEAEKLRASQEVWRQGPRKKK